MRGDGILSSSTIPAAGQPIYDSESNMLAIGDGTTDASNLYAVNAMKWAPIQTGWRSLTNYWPTSARLGEDYIRSYIIPNAQRSDEDLLLIYGYLYIVRQVPSGWEYPYGPGIVLFDYAVPIPPKEDFPRDRTLYGIAYLQSTFGVNSAHIDNSSVLNCMVHTQVGVYHAEINNDKTVLTLKCCVNIGERDAGDLTVLPDTSLILNWLCIYELL